MGTSVVSARETSRGNIYTDFSLMSRDIVEHTTLTGSRIVAVKHKSRMMLGFATAYGDRDWLFRLVDLKARNVRSSDPLLFFNLIKDDLGRDLLANAFSHSTQADVIEHMKQCHECRAYHAILEVMTE